MGLGLLIYLLLAAAGIWLTYWVIKTAVKDAIKELKRDNII